jgi:hypothetical protein
MKHENTHRYDFSVIKFVQKGYKQGKKISTGWNFAIARLNIIFKWIL